MITRSNKVLVANLATADSGTAPANVAALGTLELAVFDQNKVLITTGAAAAAATGIYIGVKTGETTTVVAPDGSNVTDYEVLYSQLIKKGSIRSIIESAYVAPVEDVVSLDLTGCTIVSGQRYVIRVIYKDLYEHPGQFTHTYEVYATDATVDTLGAAFVTKINAHTGRRCNAAYTAGTDVLALTAIAKDDNEGLICVNDYSRVNMTAVMYTTTVASGVTTNYVEVAGLTNTKTAGTDGVGYWKQVRDMERDCNGSKGVTYKTHWPVIEPTLHTVVNATYDVTTIMNDNIYVSANNQYEETAPLTTTICLVATYADSFVKEFIDSFNTGTATIS